MSTYLEQIYERERIKRNEPVDGPTEFGYFVNDEGWESRLYCEACAEVERLKAELDAAIGEHKNLHRLICKAAGYVHDEVDWRRDQASLSEWVSRLKADLTAEIAARNGWWDKCKEAEAELARDHARREGGA